MKGPPRRRVRWTRDEALSSVLLEGPIERDGWLRGEGGDRAYEGMRESRGAVLRSRNIFPLVRTNKLSSVLNYCSVMAAGGIRTKLLLSYAAAPHQLSLTEIVAASEPIEIEIRRVKDLVAPFSHKQAGQKKWSVQ